LKRSISLDSAVAQATQKIEESINNIKLRSSAWKTQTETDITKFQEAITELEKVNIKKELELHINEFSPTHRIICKALSRTGQKEKSLPRRFSLTKAQSQSIRLKKKDIRIC
jgi:uncharacterized protein YqgV (UPF0045/DUF77 family)